MTMACLSPPPLLAAPAARAADAAQMDANKKAGVEFYDAAINNKDFEAASKCSSAAVTSSTIRAPPTASKGFKAFLGFLREKFPNYHSDIKRVFADGDYVILHVHNMREAGQRAAAPSWTSSSSRTARSSSIGTSRRTFPRKPRNNNTMFLSQSMVELRLSSVRRRPAPRAWRGRGRSRRRSRSPAGRPAACARG